MDLHERIYRLLLVAYPREHRREYGAAMAQLARDRVRDDGGGVRTVIVWLHLAGDLALTALSERMETTMDTLQRAWWQFAAAFVAASTAVLGIGNLFGGDPGPLYGKIVAAVVGVVLAATVFVGLALRRRDEALGNVLIGVGVLPSALLTIMFWWPPVAATGILALVVAVRAFTDADRGRHRTRAADVEA